MVRFLRWQEVAEREPMSDQAERICAGLVARLGTAAALFTMESNEVRAAGGYLDYGVDSVLAHVLREAGLEDLLRAGQAMRERVGAGFYGHSSGDNWDAALDTLVRTVEE